VARPDPYHTREGREREGGMMDWAPHHTQEKAESEKVRYGGLVRPDPYHTREGRERR
jgi:hypothetical protein